MVQMETLRVAATLAQAMPQLAQAMPQQLNAPIASQQWHAVLLGPTTSPSPSIRACPSTHTYRLTAQAAQRKEHHELKQAIQHG